MTISSVNAHSALKLHIDADKRSVGSLAKELDTVKKEQARQRAKSMAQHEKQQTAQKQTEVKHRKFFA